MLTPLARQDPTVQEELARLPFRASEASGGGCVLHCPSLGRDLPPEALSALLLRHLAAYAGPIDAAAPPTDCVLAVPARFSDAQRQATRAAAEAAGLHVLRLITEPTAAALAYGFGCPAGGGSAPGQAEGARDVAEEELILVFDLGGGTLDVSLLDVGAGVFHVLASAGDARLGGNDFDGAALGWLRAAGALPPSDADGTHAARHLAAAEALKCALSDADAADVPLPGGGSARLTRAALETLCAPLLERAALPLREVLAEAARPDGSPVELGDIAAVLLVGGATRMPAVRALVQRETGLLPRVAVDPDEVVALGCAVQAAALVGTIGRDEVILLDETPDVEDVQARAASRAWRHCCC